MKSFTRTLNVTRKYSKAFELFKLGSITGSAQAVVQAIGLFSGILIIRLLPTEEYAVYTIANTMLGTMTILADAGIGAGVMAQGGKVWSDRRNLGKVLVTGMYLRKKFALVSLLVAIPALFFLLRHHGSSWIMSFLIIACLIPAFFATLSDSILCITFKLRQAIVPLQKNQIIVNVARLLLLCLSVFVFPWAFVAILAAGIPRAFGNIWLNKWSAPYADLNQKPDLPIQNKILATVTRILPTSIYYCISGQVSIWLISIFGSTVSLAQIGALTRLAAVTSLVSTIFATLIVPRFARLPDNNKILSRRLFQILTCLIILSSLIIAGVSIFYDKILWILGSDFAGLKNELILMSVSTSISLIGQSTNQLLAARAIIVPPIIFISSAIAVQVGAAFACQLNSVSGILLYGIYTALGFFLIRVSYLIVTMFKYERKTF